MKIRTKSILSIILIHTIFIILAFYFLRESSPMFVVAEILILISIIVSIHLYRSFIKPLNLITTGIESIKEKDFNTKFVKSKQYEMDMLVDVYNRMIDELRNERVKQQEQHYFLTKLINASPSGIVVLDLDDNVSSLNRSAESLLGVTAEEIIGKPLNSIEANLASELYNLKSGESNTININGLQAYKCRKSHFLDRGFQHHFILIEELAEEMLKAEKRAYGKVIRMMSHEVNNSIGAINSILSSSLNYKSQLNQDDSNDFDNALNVAIDRNNRLNRFMSNFTDVVKIPQPVKEEQNLHNILHSINTLMGAECSKRNIQWKWELDNRPLKVDIDGQQFEQVIVNIIKNSMEAIGQDGTITIITENMPSKSLIIRDDGKGIPKDIQKHIFEPFFSTKQSGQGIGLTLIREILINHGLRFSLETMENNQTEFRIDFSS
ncbi:MAG: PAS domain-containing protein [candidate division Zixibacteria bacterium]|nr:PAS domain-containing protein [candidate division Zixibacteria bacterium]